MTKEISKEVIAKVFGLYYECQCVYTNIIGNFYSDVNYDVLRRLYTQPSFSPQLILSDLSDISDEDINSAWERCGMAPYVNDFSKEYFLNTFDPSKASDLDNRFGQSIYLKVYDKLREMGYMLPAFGIPDLFEAGIAVRKNKEV